MSLVHLGIIADGNRRWAKAQGLPTIEGHKKGLEVIEEGQLPFWENGVKYFTILGPNREKLEFNQYL